MNTAKSILRVFPPLILNSSVEEMTQTKLKHLELLKTPQQLQISQKKWDRLWKKLEIWKMDRCNNLVKEGDGGWDAKRDIDASEYRIPLEIDSMSWKRRILSSAYAEIEMDRINIRIKSKIRIRIQFQVKWISKNEKIFQTKANNQLYLKFKGTQKEYSAELWVI